MTSVLKAMLGLEKGVIPPNRNFEVPHPKSKCRINPLIATQSH